MSIDRHAMTASVASVVPTLDPADARKIPAPEGTPHIDGYRITAKLGQGGMGTVWRALQLSTRREVALKLLGPGFGASQKARVRFDREVELAARLEHPHLARVYDSGVDKGVYFYAMELIEGMHLDTYVATRRLSKRQILDLMRTISRAMQHAHQRGVIHRDLKPSNILVTPDGQPHIVDFGLAKTLLEHDSRDPISVDGDVAGTPAYMSPEQAAGKIDVIDTRSDVYSLGVILYQLLTGSTPHDTSGTSYQVMKRIVEEDPRRPRSVSRTIDRETEALLLKSLARNPEQRYASAGEFAADIDNYLNGDPLTAKKPTTTYFLVKKFRKHRMMVGICVAILLPLIGFPLGQYIYLATKKVSVPINTWPRDAVLYVNGERHACGTPCFVILPPGTHEVQIVPPSKDYRATTRIIQVSMGQALMQMESEGFVSGETEPILLQPNFENVTFVTNLEDAILEVRDFESDELIARHAAPHTMRLAAGRYRVRYVKEGYLDVQATHPFVVKGNTQPRTEFRRLYRDGEIPSDP